MTYKLGFVFEPLQIMNHNNIEYNIFFFFFFFFLSQNLEPNTGPVIYYKIMSLTNT